MIAHIFFDWLHEISKGCQVLQIKYPIHWVCTVCTIHTIADIITDIQQYNNISGFSEDSVLIHWTIMYDILWSSLTISLNRVNEQSKGIVFNTFDCFFMIDILTLI